MSQLLSLARKPTKCLRCAGKVVAILYGEPTLESFEKAKKNEIVLGGCCMSEENPHWQCVSCGQEFLKKDAAPGELPTEIT